MQWIQKLADIRRRAMDDVDATYGDRRRRARGGVDYFFEQRVCGRDACASRPRTRIYPRLVAGPAADIERHAAHVALWPRQDVGRRVAELARGDDGPLYASRRTQTKRSASERWDGGSRRGRGRGRGQRNLRRRERPIGGDRVSRGVGEAHIPRAR